MFEDFTVLIKNYLSYQKTVSDSLAYHLIKNVLFDTFHKMHKNLPFHILY